MLELLGIHFGVEVIRNFSIVTFIDLNETFNHDRELFRHFIS
jgi:hypothetical protein